MKTNLDLNESQILNLIGHYHELENIADSHRKSPIPFCEGDENERKVKNIREHLTAIAKEYELRGKHRDRAIELLKLYVDRFFSLDAANELIAECEAKDKND